MKMRTDFVTNSSSSSFVVVSVNHRELFQTDSSSCSYYEDAKRNGEAIKKAKCKTGNELIEAIFHSIFDDCSDPEFGEWEERKIDEIRKINDVSELESMCLEVWCQLWGEAEEPEHEGAVSVIGRYELDLRTNRGKYTVDED